MLRLHFRSWERNKRWLYQIKRKSHILSTVFLTVTSNVCLREGIKTIEANFLDTIAQLLGKLRHVAFFPLKSRILGTSEQPSFLDLKFTCIALVVQNPETESALAPCSPFQKQLFSGKTERHNSQPETQLGKEPAMQGEQQRKHPLVITML